MSTVYQVNEVTIDCNEKTSCSGMDVLAWTVYSLSINCRGWETCANSNIRCPHHSEHACSVKCSSNLETCENMKVIVGDDYVIPYLNLSCPSTNVSHLSAGCDSLSFKCGNQNQTDLIWNEKQKQYICDNTGSLNCCPWLTTPSPTTQPTIIFVGSFTDSVLVPYCGSDITQQLFGNKDDFGFLLTEYDIGRLTVDNYLDFIIFIYFSMFVQIILSFYCVGSYGCYKCRWFNNKDVKIRKRKAQVCIKLFTRIVLAFTVILSLTVIAHLIYDIHSHYKHLNQIISNNYFDSVCDTWNDAFKCEDQNQVDKFPYTLGLCTCQVNECYEEDTGCDNSIHSGNDCCLSSYYRPFEVVKMCRWTYYLLIGQNVHIFQYAIILSFVVIDALFYIVTMCVLSCGMAYCCVTIQQLISCCCSWNGNSDTGCCKPKNCPHCRDNKCIPFANRCPIPSNIGTECCQNYCCCFHCCLIVPIVPFCFWFGLGLVVSCIVVFITIAALALTTLLGLIAIFVMVTILAIPLLWIQFKCKCNEFFCHIWNTIISVFYLNTSAYHAKIYNTSFCDFTMANQIDQKDIDVKYTQVQQVEDEYDDDDLSDIFKSDDTGEEHGIVELTTKQMKTKNTILAKECECKEQKEKEWCRCFACVLNQPYDEPKCVYLCHNCAAFVKQNKTLFQMFYAAKIDHIQHEKYRKRMSSVRQLNTILPFINLFILILLISMTQCIVAMLLNFWSNKWNWYNTWYFYPDYISGFYEAFKNWYFIITNKDNLLEFLEQIITLSFSWRSVITFFGLFDEFRFTMLFFKACLQIILFILYQIDKI